MANNGPITIEIDSRSVMDALNELMRRGQDMRPVMDSIGQRFEERVSGRFESKTDPNGNRWEPHPTLGYPWEYDRNYPKDGNRSLLDRTGDMLQGIGHIFDAHSVTIGFDKPYALYHEYGTKHMERRGMLFGDPYARTLGAEDDADILKLVRGYFAESI